MYLKKFSKTFSVGLIMIVFSNCHSSKNITEKNDFKTPYQFSSSIANKVAKDTVPWKHQLSAANYANKGDYRNALIEWDLAMGTRERNYNSIQIDSIKDLYATLNAKKYIIEKAKKTNVIIINEAHHNSFHRVFTKSLLKELYDLGYRNLGLEALGNGGYLDKEINIRKYPILESGYYTKDPQFGNLIREALAIGYELFPYENTGEGNGKEREIAQAQNIQKYMSTKPNEKFLIHCGFEHVLEGKHKSWEKAMASRLTEYTGIDPLTINQVIYSERSDVKFNHPFRKAFDIDESSVIINKTTGEALPYKRREAWADLIVLHPLTSYINNRPHWVFQGANKNVSINLKDISIEFPVMLLAYKKGEPIDLAVPIDVTEVTNRNLTGHLGLKKGTYEIIVTNGAESLKLEKRVH
ncbi:hypothetical protein [Zhouia amylolytica]|uniref:Uncharacterized protein n=1 Tax=Zhouia amylolytica AD3 TaxID=1286632 RepID=W2UR31_9FLAO|nr:hypothetical protein [Zhouia amylolytica]ETN96625.1 hypothetical protein P278_00510 [Zhouia amylolytica AD3]